MKLLLLFLGVFGFFSQSYGNSQTIKCGTDLLHELPAAEVLKVCQKESLVLEYDQLDRWIGETERICRVTAPFEKDPQYYEKCIDNIVTTSRTSLVCETEPKRYEEVVALEKVELSVRMKDTPIVRTPARIQKLFDRLTNVADNHYSFTFARPQWKLLVFKAKYRNATAQVDGTITLSENFWQGKNKFTTGEIAAILSHEISHVILRHYMKTACLSLSWVGRDTTLKESMGIMTEEGAFFTSSGFGKARSKLSQKGEYEADNMATFVLTQAGMDSRLMAKALKKLKPKKSGGFSTGSHPEFDDRIKRVE